jgi:hypothetical protein
MLAQFHPDSVEERVAVADLEVAGDDHGEAMLTLRANGQWLAAIGDSSIEVAIDGRMVRTTVVELSRGLVVKVFSKDQRFTLAVSLRRVLRQLPLAPVRLDLELRAGRVVKSKRPFSSDQQALAALTSDCQFDAPGTWCGVGIEIAPFYAPHGWGGGGFQSQPGTGASTNIRITFSREVSHFGIIVYDPDYVGNRIIVNGSGGQVLASYEVPGDNTAGALTIQPYEVSIPGIRSVDLIAAPADYIGFNQAEWSDSIPITVTCSGAVLRGELVACVASSPSGTTVAVSQWKFTSANLSAPIIEQSSKSQWAGPAATGGQVVASGLVNGLAASGQASIAVTDRNWTSKTVPHTVIEKNQSEAPLPIHPVRVGELGATANIPGIFPGLTGYSSVIDSGPQKGVAYWTDMPAVAQSWIFINRIAMAVNSDWYKLQPKNGAPPGICNQSKVLPFIPVVEAHEGLQLQLGSHAEVFKRKMNELVPQVTESVVILGFESDLIDKTTVAATPAFNQAVLIAGDTHSGGTVPPAPYPCTFKYFTP